MLYIYIYLSAVPACVCVCWVIFEFYVESYLCIQRLLSEYLSYGLNCVSERVISIL